MARLRFDRRGRGFGGLLLARGLPLNSRFAGGSRRLRGLLLVGSSTDRRRLALGRVGLLRAVHSLRAWTAWGARRVEAVIPRPGAGAVGRKALAWRVPAARRGRVREAATGTRRRAPTQVGRGHVHVRSEAWATGTTRATRSHRAARRVLKAGSSRLLRGPRPSLDKVSSCKPIVADTWKYHREYHSFVLN